jgi:tRNA pseudouridine55 synthase
MNGFLALDKPAGLTSHDVVARVRRILRERRTGHTGTLDPFATGVLVVLVGRATRLAQFLSGADKTYKAVIRFGYATDTGDLTGAPRPETASRVVEITAQDLEDALASLRGAIAQTPPMYSAKKVRGKKLYELARAGQEIERRAVPVTVHRFEAAGPFVCRDDSTADLPVVVSCSAGAYVRALAEDLGARLGLGAHLAALRRTRAGAISLDEAVTLEELERRGAAALRPAAEAFPDWPVRLLTEEEARRAGHGQSLSWTGAPWPAAQLVKLLDARGELVAVYEAAGEMLRPRVVLDGK